MKRLETECESPEVKRSLYLYAFNFGKDTPEAKNLGKYNNLNPLHHTTKIRCRRGDSGWIYRNAS